MRTPCGPSIPAALLESSYVWENNQTTLSVLNSYQFGLYNNSRWPCPNWSRSGRSHWTRVRLSVPAAALVQGQTDQVRVSGGPWEELRARLGLHSSRVSPKLPGP